MEKSVSWVFGGMSTSVGPRKFKVVESVQERWAFLSQGETREGYEKAIHGNADSDSSLYIQNILDKNKHKVSNILGYFDFQFDRARMEQEFQKYETECPLLAQPQHRDDIIKHLLSPNLHRVIIVSKFLDEDLPEGRDLLSIDMPPEERLFSLLNFLYQMNVISERGEPISITQIHFEYENTAKNFQLAAQE